MTNILKDFTSHTKLSTCKRAEGMSPAAVRFLKSYLERYVQENKKISRITFIKWLASQDLALTTKSTLAQGIGKFLYWGGYIPESDYGIIKKSFRAPFKDWSDQSVTSQIVDDFINYISSTDTGLKRDRNILIIGIVALIGLRVSQVVEINMADIVERQDVLCITVHRKKHNNMARKNLDYKEIPLDRVIGGYRVGDLLKRYLKQRNKKFENSKAYFINKYGSRITTSYIQLFVRECATAVGHKGITPHSFRHHAGHRIAQKDIVAAAAVLGHQSINTTMKYINPSQLNTLPLI